MPKKILICEDERFIHELMRKTLQDGGYETSSAYTGEGLLNLAGGEPAAVILLDMMLPDMDGVQILSELKTREKNAQTPVIVLSASSEEEIREKLTEFSIANYIQKPFNPVDLLKRVHEACSVRNVLSADRPRILVVEDSHVHQKVVGRFLEDNEYQPIYAETVKEAIQILSTFTPSAIILDLHFYGESGLDVLKELKSRGESIPVIVVSGIIDKDILAKLSLYKIHSVLSKPIVVSRLKEELDAAFATSTDIFEDEKPSEQVIRILLVEDFLMTVRVTQKALTDMGFRVLSARDGASALAILATNPIDFIALDVNLPEMNGVEFLERARQKGYKTPCAVVSGNLDAKKQSDLRRLGVEKFFTKPLNFKEFGSYVDGLLQGGDSAIAKTSAYDILIAMNSEQTGRLVEEIVTSMGYTSMLVDDGFLALAELKGEPKLVIFDVVLGGMDGPDLARRAGPPDQRRTRLLALAEFLDEGMEEELDKLGIDASLHKPFHREELTSKIEELMAGTIANLSPADFTEEFQELLQGLPAESDVSYWPKIRTFGHDLRGSAMYINRPDLASLGKKIEDAVVGDDHPTAAETLEEVRGILREIRKNLNLPDISEKIIRSEDVIVQ
ncbi:response regulator [bacterium]|nr:response regulator [bacterium]